MAKTNGTKRRWGVMYYVAGNKWDNPDTWGSTTELVNAYGKAAQHVARSDLLPGEYRKAIIYDRLKQNIVRSYTRTVNGITIKDF